MDDGFDRDRRDSVADMELAAAPHTPVRFGPNGQPIKDSSAQGGIIQQLLDDPNAACE